MDKLNLLLDKMGMPRNLKGRKYIVEAVKLVIKDEDYLQVTKRLYPTLAKQFDTKPGRVERAIRHTIEVCFDNISPDTINEIFGNTINYRLGKPTNTHFIATIAEKIKNSEFTSKESELIEEKVCALKNAIVQAAIKYGLNLVVYDGKIGFVDHKSMKIVALWTPGFRLPDAKEIDDGTET